MEALFGLWIHSDTFSFYALQYVLLLAFSSKLWLAGHAFSTSVASWVLVEVSVLFLFPFLVNSLIVDPTSNVASHGSKGVNLDETLLKSLLWCMKWDWLLDSNVFSLLTNWTNHRINWPYGRLDASCGECLVSASRNRWCGSNVWWTQVALSLGRLQSFTSLARYFGCRM